MAVTRASRHPNSLSTAARRTNNTGRYVQHARRTFRYRRDDSISSFIATAEELSIVMSGHSSQAIRLAPAAPAYGLGARAVSNSNTELLTLCVLTVLAYSVALAIVGSVLFRHYGFPLDDSWIHQSIARNLAHFGSLGYLPDEPSSGSTSLLWTLITSVNYLIAPGVNPVLFTLAINATCIFAIGILLLRICLRDGMSAPLALLVAVAPALDGNYLWLAFTGMEHLLFVTLSIASIWLWLGTSRETNRLSWTPTLLSGLCMGLLCMTRPEGLVLPGLLLAAALLFPRFRTRSTGQILVAGAIAFVLASIPIAVNLYTSHSLLPVTFKGRQWLFVSSHDGWFTTRLLLIEQWISRPIKAVLSFDGVGLGHAAQATMLAAFACVIVLVGYAVRDLVTGRRRLLLAVCAWGALHALLYAVMLPASGHGGRYQPFFLLLLLPLVGLGLARVFGKSPLRAPLAASVGLLTIGSLSLLMWNRVLASSIDHINRTHGVVAAWLMENLPDETVAVFDIGRVGYDRATRGIRGNPGVIDLGGLTDASYVGYLYGHRVPLYLAQRNIRYVVLPVDPAGRSGIASELGLADNVAVTRSTVYRACSPAPEWQLSWSETRNATQCQEVDRVSFNP
jgi:hypothetical protein